jgi:hypothetical protein
MTGGHGSGFGVRADRRRCILAGSVVSMGMLVRMRGPDVRPGMVVLLVVYIMFVPRMIRSRNAFPSPLFFSVECIIKLMNSPVPFT